MIKPGEIQNKARDASFSFIATEPTSSETIWDSVKCDFYIVLEYMFAHQVTEGILTEKEMVAVIEHSGFRIIDRIYWDLEDVRRANRHNTKIIRRNVERLSSMHPEKKGMFQEFLRNQFDECEMMESGCTCAALLIGL
jgi:hypothetical protein